MSPFRGANGDPGGAVHEGVQRPSAWGQAGRPANWSSELPVPPAETAIRLWPASLPEGELSEALDRVTR